MTATNNPNAGQTIIEEVRRVVTFVEETTGLPSRWNGGLLILADSTDEAWSAQVMPRVSYRAKKEWSCSITVMESIVQDDQRWRTLLHECLHSVSIGLTEPSYQRLRLWEEPVVESLQRLYRPLLFRHLSLVVDERQFQPPETTWLYNQAIDALKRIATQRPEVPLRQFLEEMLRIPLPNRPAFVFDWGRGAADFEHFKRVYAAASSVLRG